MKRVIENLKGPPDSTVVGAGRMLYSRKKPSIRVGRYCSGEKEGFQVDFLSMVEDQETGGSPMVGKQYRVVREGIEVSALTYLPSERRGRKISFVPLDGVLGSEYLFYFLPTVTNLHFDFSYRYAEDGTKPVIVGIRKSISLSPFPHITLYLEKLGGSYVIEKAIYEQEEGESIAQILEEYEEFTPGYWAPRKVVTGGTTLIFSRWGIKPPLEWLLSQNHETLELHHLPSPLEVPTR